MNEADNPDITHLPLHEITRERGESGLLDRLSAEIESSDWDEETKQTAYGALDHALSAHEGTSRGKHPYSTHFLRVAIRIMSRNHFAIRDRPDLIIAALLHDTVEDHPNSYLRCDEIIADQENNQSRALVRIAQIYGEPEAVLVSSVTNPIMPSGLSRSEKNSAYQAHVIELLGNEMLAETGAGIIKLSDFVDNCVGLLHNEDNNRAKRLAEKYAPLIPHMIAYVMHSGLLQPRVGDKLVAQLEEADKRCYALLTQQAA